jgi:Protein of unknown function (DUF3224)
MTTHVTGVFDVKIIRQPAEALAAGDSIGRMLLDKRFHGDLDATSVGQMLAMRTAVEGSAGYVAMELVTGRLQGKSGTFVLQHSGTMNRGQATLDLHVVPDSGTQELQGLSGKMAIDIRDGQHFYTFDYEIIAGS